MDINEKNEALTNIFKNEMFKREAENLRTVTDLQKLISKYGLTLTEQEVTEVCVAIGKQMEAGELDENALEEVAGGFGWIAVGCIAVGVYCIGSFAVGVYNGYRGNY